MKILEIQCENHKIMKKYTNLIENNENHEKYRNLCENNKIYENHAKS